MKSIIELSNCGLIDGASLLNKYIIYDKFLNMEGSKTERYKALAREYRIHPNSVQRIVLQMKQVC